MNDIILYGELDIYSYLDLSNHETDYYNILNLKNRRFPAKIVYKIEEKDLFIYVSFPREITDSRIVTVITKNSKVNKAEYYEVDKLSLFILKFDNIKFYIPKARFNNSIILNIVGGNINANEDSTIYLYQNLDNINELFIGINREYFISDDDIVYLYKVNPYNNLEFKGIIKIININKNIVTIRPIFILNNITINDSNQFIIVKYIFDSIEPLSGVLMSEYLIIDGGISARINHLINLIT